MVAWKPRSTRATSCPAHAARRDLPDGAGLIAAGLLVVASLAAPSCDCAGSDESESSTATSSTSSSSGAGGGGGGVAGSGVGGGISQGGGGAGPECVPYDVPTYEPAASDAAALGSLAEAAGYGSNDNSGWVAAAAGDFCGDGEMELALFKNSATFLSVLRGPTPYPVAGSGLLSSAAHPWRAAAAADLDGDGKAELVALRHVTAAGVPDVVAFDFDAQCAATELASGTIGTTGNSDWVAVAVADVDGDATLELVGLKQAHSSFVVMRREGSSIVSEHAADLDSAPAYPWHALAAGDLDNDGAAELVAARASSDGAATVLAYRWGSGSFAKIAESTVGSSGNSSWAGATIGDFNGDGDPVLVLAKAAHTSFLLLDLDGSATLASAGNMDLDSDPAQPWRAVTAGDWLGGDEGADELVAVREASGPFAVDVLVYGNALHAARRASAIDHTLAQYAAGSDVFTDDAPPNVALLRERLLATHANTYSMLLWDTTGKDYLDLVEVLEGTREFCVDGRALRLWVTLIPPTEAADRCSVPADSPLTDWDDREPFDPSLGIAGCLDYPGWGEALGRLAGQYSHLVGVNVDDFSHNAGPGEAFTPEVVARMTAGMRSQAPWLALAPTLYYSESGIFVFDAWPDLGLTLDSVLFYFRNEKEGQGPCADASCPVPGSCSGACLAGACAEPTVANAPGEIADMATGLAAGRRLQLGVYASGHSQCGEPTTLYVHELLATGLAQPSITGTTVYTFKYPAGDCPDPLTDKGCAVADVFGSQ